MFWMMWTFRPITGSYDRLLTELEKGKMSHGNTWGEEKTTFSIEIWTNNVFKLINNDDTFQELSEGLREGDTYVCVRYRRW